MHIFNGRDGLKYQPSRSRPLVWNFLSFVYPKYFDAAFNHFIEKNILKQHLQYSCDQHQYIKGLKMPRDEKKSKQKSESDSSSNSSSSEADDKQKKIQKQQKPKRDDREKDEQPEKSIWDSPKNQAKSSRYEDKRRERRRWEFFLVLIQRKI